MDITIRPQLNHIYTPCYIWGGGVEYWLYHVCLSPVYGHDFVHICCKELNKGRAAFAQLQPIWKSNNYSLRTKLKLYNSNVKSVLLYGSECWRIIESDMKKVEAFHNSCLRNINKIFWPNKISNKNLHLKCKSKNISRDKTKKNEMAWFSKTDNIDLLAQFIYRLE